MEFRKFKELIKNEIIKITIKDKFLNLYHFKTIEDCDFEKLLKIRNNKRILDMMINQKKISSFEHKNFINSYKRLNRVDFIIISKKGDYVGSVYLTYKNKKLEIGKYIGDDKYLNKGIAYIASNCLISLIKKIDKSQTIFSTTRINNKINIKINEKLGFKKIIEEENFVTMILK
jgi:RimJ/RimL family protein N-acetyltransferase|tara:strand:+ start:137 stop:658 length:522 start_codon:yes stop_codon:yes gene_type:complete